MNDMNSKIAFIGGGNMAQAMIAGLLKAGVCPSNILVCAPSKGTRRSLVDKFNINVAEKNAYAVHFADIIFLAVKPNLTAYVCRELRTASSASGENKLIISMAAGMTPQYLQSKLGRLSRVAVIMPNLPTSEGEGVIGLIAADNMPAADKTLVADIVNLLGLTLWLDDDQQLHHLVAAAGSAPAYIYLFLEAMVESATKLGLSPSQANQAVMQTSKGAIKMAEESGLDFRALRHQVTSPNGTTEQAVGRFKANNIKQIVHDAMASASQRAKLIEESL